MLNFNFDPFPVIRTSRLTLRKMATSDAAAIFEMRTDPEVMKYIGRESPKTIDDAIQLVNDNNNSIASNEGIAWAITLSGTDQLIGICGYWRMKPEHHRAELGYLLMKNWWRKGIMDETIKAVVHYGFTEMKLHSIEADIDPQNDASASILEKNDFVREAYYKENFYWKGNFRNTAIYSLLSHDWASKEKSKHA